MLLQNEVGDTHSRIVLGIGDSVDVHLPSGRIINIEATVDYAHVTSESMSLLYEKRLREANWMLTWPEKSV